MSRAKGVVIEGHLRWVPSDVHDVVLALMVETAASLPFVPPEWLADWRICASVPDLVFSTAEAPSSAERETLRHVLRSTRVRASERGHITREQVRNWALGEGLVVSGGALYSDSIEVAQIVELLDSYLALLDVHGRDDAVLAIPRTSRSLAASGPRTVVRIEPEVLHLDARGEIAAVLSLGDRMPTPRVRDAAVIFQAARVTAGERFFLINPVDPKVRAPPEASLASIGVRERASVTYVEEARRGLVSARLIGTADRGAAALALAVWQRSWGWDESTTLVVRVDSERFEVTADYTAHQWMAVAWPLP